MRRNVARTQRATVRHLRRLAGVATIAFLGVLAGADVQTVPSAWQVRRLRASDARTGGGYPGWRVSEKPDETGVQIVIDNDRGDARGTILVGAAVRIPPPTHRLRISFAYETFCALEHRSGGVGLALFEPQAWEQLSPAPDTELIGGADTIRPVWTWTVHPMTDPDTTEPQPVGQDGVDALSLALQPYAGKTMVLAITWTGAHSAVERAAIRNLQILKEPAMLPEQELIEVLDLDSPGLQNVAAAAEEGDFSQAVSHLLQHFRTRWPTPPKASVIHGSKHDADMALDNRFRSAGSDQYFTLRHGFDWNRNAIDDQEWLVHLQWHDILLTLVTTASVTGDDRYMEKAVELIRDWLPRNPPGEPWSWRPLIVALRAMNWATVYPYLLHYEPFTIKDHAAFLRTLCTHLDYLLPEEHFHAGHNKGATECKALLRLGILFPEFRHAETWRQTAWQRLEEEITRQVLPDGAQVELTCGYHNGVMNTFFRAAQWVEGTDLTPSKLYWERLEKMHEYTAYLTKPDGMQPSVSDSWQNRSGHLVERGGEFFNRPDLVFIGSHGARGQRPPYLDRQLPAAGYYAMRTSWPDDPDGIYLFLDAAKLWGGWHSHYDALAVVLYAYGRTLMPDAGPFAYDNPLREKFKSTAFHSTVCVDNKNQNQNGCQVHAFISDPRLSFADAEHHGYDDIRHRRQILFVRPGHGIAPYVVIVDRLLGTGRHHLDLHFHLPPEDVTASPETLTARTHHPSSGNLKITGLQTGGVTMQRQTSWIQTVYGQKTDRPDICFAQEASLPALFVTLLVPFKSDALPDMDARLIEGSSALGAVGVTVRDEGGHEDSLFVGPQSAKNTLGEWSWSGRAALVRREADTGTRCQVVLADP